MAGFFQMLHHWDSMAWARAFALVALAAELVLAAIGAAVYWRSRSLKSVRKRVSAILLTVMLLAQAGAIYLGSSPSGQISVMAVLGVVALNLFIQRTRKNDWRDNTKAE